MNKVVIWLKKSLSLKSNVQVYSTILLLTAFLVMIGNLGWFNRFIYTHWLFSYRFEFIKRGLPGEIIRQLNISPSLYFVKITSLIILIVLILLFVFILYKYIYRKNSNEEALLVLSVCIITHSATISHFTKDVGRFDVLLVILMITSLILLSKTKRSSSIFFVLTISVISILVHELFFVAFLPLIVAYWFFIDTGTLFYNSLRGILVIGLAVVTYYVGTIGLMDTVTFEGYFNFLKLESDEIRKSAIKLLFNDLSDSSTITIERMASLKYLLHHIAVITILFPSFFLFKRFFYDLELKNDWSKSKKISFKCIPLMSLTPMLLIPIGFDHFRWWALSVTNLFIAMVFLSKTKIVKEHLIKICKKEKHILLIIIFFSLVFGHLGVIYSFRSVNDFMIFLDRII